MENMDYMINEMTAALQALDPEILAGGILFPAGIFAAMMAYGVLRYLMTAIANSTGIAQILFPGITALVLGLGKAEYRGKIMEKNERSFSFFQNFRPSSGLVFFDFPVAVRRI